MIAVFDQFFDLFVFLLELILEDFIIIFRLIQKLFFFLILKKLKIKCFNLSLMIGDVFYFAGDLLNFVIFLQIAISFSFPKFNLFFLKVLPCNFFMASLII